MRKSRRRYNTSTIFNKIVTGIDIVNNLPDTIEQIQEILEAIKKTIKEQQISPKPKQQQKIEKSPYDILGVNEDDAIDLIKQVYRLKCTFYHPDRTGGDKRKEQRFIEIDQAYKKILKDKER